MAIKGLTDNPKYPQIGTLRKGAEKPNERQPGRDLDHFRFVGDDPELEEVFRQAYGEEPSKIDVYLPYASTEENLDAWFEEYRASSMLRRCDGETCILWQKPDGTMSDAERPCAQREDGESCGCKESARLFVILPELEHLAVVAVVTTSKHDIKNLHGALTRYEMVARRSGGDLTGIPFTLSRVPRKISTPDGKGGRARREKWLLTIEPSTRWVSLQIRAAEERAMLAPGTIPESRQLSSGDGSASVEVGGTAETTRSLTRCDATQIKELQTACNDFGFTKDERQFRINFGVAAIHRDIESYTDLTREEASWLLDVLESVMGALPHQKAWKAFADHVVVMGLDISTDHALGKALSEFRFDGTDEIFEPTDWAEDAPFEDMQQAYDELF